MIEDGLSLLTGAGIGVLAMYLLDPESGAARRERIAETARGTLDTAGEALGQVLDAAHEKTSDWISSGREYVGDAAASGSDYLGGGSQRARKMGRSLWHSARQSLPSFEREHEYSLPAVSTAIGGGLGLLALGAASIFFFDPTLGRSRRARARDKSMRFARETGDFMRTAGRRIADHFRGTYHTAAARFTGDQPTDAQLVARVRSQLGRVVNNMGDVEVIAENGYVTLCGCAPDEEMAEAIRTAMGVRGVRGVSDQFRRQGQAPSGSFRQGDQSQASGVGSFPPATSI
jgi:gas vesicle protein